MSDEAQATATPPATAPASTPAQSAKTASAPPKADALEALREVLQPVTEKQRRAERLAKAEAKGANEVLKTLGVKKSERARVMEELKAGKLKLAEAAAETADAKAKADQAAADAARAKGEMEKLTPYVERMKKYADSEYAALPEAFQKSLVDMKIEDPIARLDMIEIWKKNGALAATAAAASPGAKPQATSKPSATMAAATPPNASPVATLNYFEQWNQLKESGQAFAAAQFFQIHGKKILEQKPR